MAETKPTRHHLSTRIATEALEVITHLAASRRTTTSQVARVLLEDAARDVVNGREGEHAASA